jgi:hypothetical protein
MSVARDVARLVGTLTLLGAIIGGGYYAVSRFINRPDTALEVAVREADVAGVARHLGPRDDSGGGSRAYAVYELALRHLSPSDGRTTEILRLILEREPQPRRIGLTGPIPRSANLEFRPPRSAGMGSATDTTIAAVEIAAERWSADGVRALLEHGLDVKSRGVSGAMTAAAANRCVPVITLLLDAGADVNARDRDRDTPLAMARRMKHDDVVTLLVSRGARD